MLVYVIPSGLRYFRAAPILGLRPMFANVIPSGLRYHSTISLSHEVVTFISEAAKPLAPSRELVINLKSSCYGTITS